MYKITKHTPNYVPSFRGKHNATRCKAWLLLYDRFLGNKRDLSLKELSEITEIGYKSLSVCLVKWIRWRYIGFNNHQGGRRYHILKRGRDWLERWQDQMPLEAYLSEMGNAARENNNPHSRI
jgi:hypothetical protein